MSASASFDAFLQAVRGTLAAPFANASQSALLAAIAIAALLAVVVLLLMAATPRQTRVVKVRRYRPRAGDDTAAGAAGDEDDGGADDDGARQGAVSAQAGAVDSGAGGRAFARAGAVAAPVLVLAALLFGYLSTGTDGACITFCHANEAAVVAASQVHHASCIACHEAPGAAGLAANIASRVTMAYGRLRSTPPDRPTAVDSLGCLTCHASVLGTVTVSAGGLRMSHAAPVAAGRPCVVCHGAVGHAKSGDTFSMSGCVVCHDGRLASAACQTCHVRDPLDEAVVGMGDSTGTIGSGRIPFPLVEVGTLTCGGCHDEAARCDPCHGLRMPHPKAFLAGGHARQAAFERKRSCWKCHVFADCGGCHSLFENSHAADWKKTHGLAGWQAGCGCHQGVSGRKTPMCPICHDRPPS
jgi:hypothetical protein